MSSLWKIVITVVVTALVVGYGTYYLVGSKAQKDKAALQTSIDSLNKKVASLEGTSSTTDSTTTTPSTTTPSTTTTTDVTADWNSFSSKTYGYKIKYPKNWYIDSTRSDTGFTSRDGGGDPIGGDTYWSNYSKFNYTPDALPTDRQLVTLLIYKTSKTLNAFYSSQYVGTNVVTGPTNTTIAGKDAIKVTFNDTDSPVKTHVVLVKISTGVMIFSYSVNTKTDASTTFDTIISSLSFN